MPVVTKYEPGTPSWIDLSSTDVDAAREFYRTVLGWEQFDVGPEEAGFYTMVMRDGKAIAGMANQQDAEKDMAVPPHHR